MGNNEKKNSKTALFFGAGVCFLLAAIFNKDTLDIVLGCAWVCIGLMWVRKNRKSSED